ncbi:flavin reductase family protein [Lentibacter algarum]|uniref:flavin reductase family protein n=1 Tax=Lentibacter algarum TaxID=576131 RepID=UPI001C06B5E2|nr:flavin reductase family protein [Lentibacter algarum]MBU2981786.1 flavin reductase family protein [Lentibacter algarum]
MNANGPQTGDDKLRGGFLEAMSHAANTVYVVTTDGPAGRAGVTVSAFSSVSADVDQPRLLICLHHESTTADIIRTNGVFCVNMLRSDQAALADRFAGRIGAGGDKFAEGNWGVTEAGMPCLTDALASLECRLSEQTLVGTHHVLFGAVQNVRLTAGPSPLIYASRNYTKLSKT